MGGCVAGGQDGHHAVDSKKCCIIIIIIIIITNHGHNVAEMLALRKSYHITPQHITGGGVFFRNKQLSTSTMLTLRWITPVRRPSADPQEPRCSRIG